MQGDDVTVSFWNLPVGNGNCARYDGTKGWLWSDTDCTMRLNYICQHRKCFFLFNQGEYFADNLRPVSQLLVLLSVCDVVF